MQPQLSISTAFSYATPVEEQVALISRAGFSHISLGVRPEHSGYDDASRRNTLKVVLEQHGMRVDTVHARGFDTADAVAEAMATIEAAADLGAHCVVAHGGPFMCDIGGFGERVDNLVSTCRELAPAAASHGVVIALENVMPGPATDLIRMALSELDSGVFGLCYDSAHDQIDGPRSFDLLDEFQDRLFAVHLSDRIRPMVDHVVPGEGFIEWATVCRKLRQASYTKPILMEVMMEHSRYQEPELFLKEVHRAGENIWRSVNGIDGV